MTTEFFSPKNEAMLQRVLYSDICRRIGGDLNEKEAGRLMKTVKHYMIEVDRVKGSSAPVPVLNKEVLQVVLPDYMMYMERNTRSSGRSVISDIEVGPSAGGAEVMGALEDMPRGQGQGRAQMDVGAAFSQLQANRQAASRPRAPEMQDFRLSLSDEGPVPMDVFERIKNDREAEATRQAAVSAGAAAAGAAGGGMMKFVNATDGYSRDRRRAEEEAEAAYAEIERKQLEARAAAAAEAEGNLPAPPDMRSLFLGDRKTLDRSMNRAAGNATLALGDMARDSVNSRQQAIITREPSSMEYKENELNLFVYSGDRDWISNSTETRYNFSVSFDPANMPNGLRVSPTSTVKFRNIVRIEFVKAIMPGESLDTMVTRSYSGSSFTYSAPYNFNILSFPYVQVRIPELDNNIYGTNLGLNASFGILQYDANWIYDTNNALARGYFAMIPKFLKCQKVYSPTPLATIQKLTFRFERPDGTLVSTVPDTLDIGQVFSSKIVGAAASNPYGYDSSVENGGSAAYYYLKTSTYFNQFTVSKGDRIVIKNMIWSASPVGNSVQQLQDLTTFIQQDAGFLVVDTGFSSGGISSFAVGTNSQGYCNYIVIRGKFSDPTTGSTTTTSLGGLADSSSPGSLVGNSLSEFLNANTMTYGRLLNQSHQVQVSLRVITREMDPTSVLRPDNL